MKQNTKRIPVKGTSRRIVIVPGETDSVFEKMIFYNSNIKHILKLSQVVMVKVQEKTEKMEKISF